MGRTVAELKASMSLPEFSDWIDFFRDFPFDDEHRYHRPHALIASAIGSNGKIEMSTVSKILNWLQPEQIPEGLSEVDMSVLKAFGGKIKD